MSGWDQQLPRTQRVPDHQQFLRTAQERARESTCGGKDQQKAKAGRKGGKKSS
jgi:hypothetical protein